VGMSQKYMEPVTPHPPVREAFLKRVLVRNYKSIGKCDVSLARLTALVGRNGAGKSNFLDALRFVADGLQTSLDHAIKSRGGIQMVRRTSTGHPRNFTIELQFNLPEMKVGRYGFEVAGRPGGGCSVKWEKLEVLKPNNERTAYYSVEEGECREGSWPTMPKAVADRLYLVVASGLPEFREVYDGLTAMGFYNLNPEAMKELQSPDAGELLHRDGNNIASVIARLEKDDKDEKQRVEQYLEKIISGIDGVTRRALGPRETLEFRQHVKGAKDSWSFLAASMSDGTLRALGTLVAISQLVHAQERVLLVGIEEPETALHPAAAQALMDALNEGKQHTQIVITTHSADLLDKLEFDEADIAVLAVDTREGETRIAPMDEASRKAVREHLYSVGELLRMDQVEPDRKNLQEQEESLLFRKGAEE
jgi:predicted ATPase